MMLEPDAPARLSREERQEQILANLKLDGAVRIAALAEGFNVTTETARRDLDELAQRGLVLRTYGGATSRRSLTDEPAIGSRRLTHVAERSRIAGFAASLVQPGDALMVDCGSTTALFAQALARRNLRLTVVTNCIPVAMAMGASARARVVICPGDYVAREGGIYGTEAVEFIRRHQADKAFIGAGGLTPEGVTDADSRSCWIKRAMIERAGKTVLLIDSTKFEVPQFERVCSLGELDAIVSDSALPPSLLSPMRAAGLDFHVAEGK